MKSSLQELRKNKNSKNGYLSCINSKKVSEMDTILEASADGVITEQKFPVQACSEFELWFFPKLKNLAGGQTITVKFYKYLNENPVLAETVTVISPAVTKDEAGKVDVLTTKADIESYDAYSVSGTVTVVAGGTVDILLGKKSQG